MSHVTATIRSLIFRIVITHSFNTCYKWTCTLEDKHVLDNGIGVWMVLRIFVFCVCLIQSKGSLTIHIIYNVCFILVNQNNRFQIVKIHDFRIFTNWSSYISTIKISLKKIYLFGFKIVRDFIFHLPSPLDHVIQKLQVEQAFHAFILLLSLYCCIDVNFSV